MRAVTIKEPGVGMRQCQAAHQLARIHAHPGEFVSDAVSGIQGNRHSIPYCFILRYSVVRPIPSKLAALAFSPRVSTRAFRMACFSVSGSEITGDGDECTN